MAFGTSAAGMFSGAAGGSFVGGAIVRMVLDRADFIAGLKTSEAQMHAFGQKMTRVGTGMARVGAGLTRNVTLPIIAAGAASVKLAVDFEGAFTRIRANSNLTGKEIDKLRKHVLNLAGQTAKSPQELAEGLYFLASAGLNANQVQETLTMSAKASAAGFGVVGDIARLTANALNAYAKDGLKAKEVTDTLAAAIREGTAEPEEFAGALGRILPFAQKAGVGFDEVTASLASLSTIGLDVNEGVTAMRGLLTALLAPGTQAKDTLKEFGLSADEVRKVLADDGLLAVMRLLEERTGGNIDAIRKMIPNVRAMSALFGITGQKAEQVNGSFRRVIGATGDLDKAFKKTKKDPGFQMKQLLSELQTMAIEIGTEALPVLKDVVGVVKDLIEGFRAMPKPMRDNIVKWGLLAAALGPVLRLMGGILRTGGRLIGVMPRLGAALGLGGAAGTGTAGGTAATAAKAAGGGGALAGLARVSGGAMAGPAAVATAFPEGAPWDAVKRAQFHEGFASVGMVKDLEAAQEKLERLDARIEGFGRNWLGNPNAPQGLQGKAAALQKAIDAYPLFREEQFDNIHDMSGMLDVLGGKLSDSETRHLEAALAVDDFKTAQKILNEALDEATKKYSDQQKPLREMQDGFQGWSSSAFVASQEMQRAARRTEQAIERMRATGAASLAALIEAYGNAKAAAEALAYANSVALDPFARTAPGGGGRRGGGSGGHKGGGGKSGGGGGSQPSRMPTVINLKVGEAEITKSVQSTSRRWDILLGRDG